MTAADSVGPYRLGRALGSGGAATVYASTDRGGRPIAIKLLGREVLDDVAQLARFRREVDALGRLDHPNVIRLLDSGIDEARGPYLVTPLIDGRTARELLAAAGGGAPELALVLGAAVASGLAAVHAAGLVHRDLKPDNLIVTAAGELVIIDFGLALHPAHSRHTREGAIAGSVPYMAPEQIAGQEVTAASDVWSAGVMLYEWCAGVRPFSRPRQQEEVAAILAGLVTPLDQSERRVSAPLRDLVGACLSTDPARRPRDGAALLAAIEQRLSWFPPAERATELAAAARDPRGYQEAVAPMVVARILAGASALIAADPFAAVRSIDRGLAYQPDSADLQALAAEAMRASARARPAPAVHPSPARRSRRALWWSLGAVALLGVAAAIGVIASGSGAPNMSDPASVLEAVFEAARSGDTSHLPGLCDPQQENDGDTRDICTMTPNHPRWPQFRSVFVGGTIAGPPRIGGAGAEVDFYFAGGKKETMKMVRRGSEYYLSSF